MADDPAGILPGTLDLLILKAVSLGELHGYGVLLRVQQMTKAYRFKGAMTRGWRALLVLEAIQRLIAGPPNRRLEKLRTALDLKEAELRQLRAEIHELEQKLAIADTGGTAAERGAA